MAPGGGRVVVLIGPWAVQDGLGIDLVRSFFRLAVWVRFFGPLERLLGSSWVAFGFVLDHLGLSWGRLGLSWARFWAVRMACWSPITLNSHQLINSSTIEPMAGQHFATWAGGLRAARLE